MSYLFGGGDSTTTTETKKADYVSKAEKSAYEGAEKGMAGYNANPEAYVAPMNEYQNAVGTGAGELTNYAKGTDYSSQASGQVGSLDSYIGSSAEGALNNFIGGNSAGAVQGYIGSNMQGMANPAIQRSGDTSQITMDAINAFANPYAEQMTDIGMRRLGESYDRSNSDIGNQAAAAGAFGGSNEAVRRSLLDRDMASAAGDLSTQIAYDSFNQGSQLAGQNVAIENDAISRQVASMLEGAGMDMQAQNDYFNRGLESANYDEAAQNNYFNRGKGAAEFDASERNSVYERAKGASEYDLAAINAANDASNDYVTRYQSALGTLGSYGDKVQDQNQKEGDKDWTSYQRYANMAAGNGDTTTTETTPTNNSAGIGAILAALGYSNYK